MATDLALRQDALEPWQDVSSQLARLNRALSEAATIPDALSIADYGDALRFAVKRAGLGLTAANAATEVRILAERRAGALLLQLDRKTYPGHPSDYQKTRTTLGLSMDICSRYQRLAKLDEGTIESYVAKCSQSSLEASTQGLLRQANRLTARDYDRPGGRRNRLRRRHKVQPKGDGKLDRCYASVRKALAEAEGARAALPVSQRGQHSAAMAALYEAADLLLALLTTDQRNA